MDDSFSFRTTLPQRPRIDPWMVKGAVIGTLILLGIGVFAGWVVASERASFARLHHRGSPDVGVGRIDDPVDPSGTDADAVRSTRIALDAARAAFSDQGSFLAADPSRLSALQPGFTFVDGPSTTSRIVSVAASRDVWAAAVLGPGGTCFWIRAEAGGAVDSGTSSWCTGASVLEGSRTGTSGLAGRRIT